MLTLYSFLFWWWSRGIIHCALLTSSAYFLTPLDISTTDAGLDPEREIDPKTYGLLYSLKSVCQNKRPGVRFIALFNWYIEIFV